MLTKEGKKSILIHGILLVLWIGLLVLASFKDLEISQKISTTDGFFGAIGALFAVIGEWPSYLITPFATIVLLYNVDNMTSKKGANITLKVVFTLLHFVGWFLLFQGGEFMPTEIMFTIAYTLLAGIPCIFFARFVSQETMQKLLKFAVFTLIVLVASRVIVTIIKLGWSRPRYRDMIKYNNAFEYFTPWYHPNGLVTREGWKLTSFPSGHVTSATNLFVIVVLCDIFPKLKNKKTLMYTVVSIYVALTMLFRVVYRAHFLSDTLWAVLITYVIFYITKALFFRNGKYVYDVKNKNNELSVDNDNIKVDNIKE